LTPIDLFLWGYLKTQVYARKQQSIQELEGYIEDKAAKIPQSMCENVVNCFVERLRCLIDVHG